MGNDGQKVFEHRRRYTTICLIRVMVKLLKDLFKSTATHPDHATQTILERLVDRVCEGRPDINSQTRSCRPLCIVRPDGYLPSSNPSLDHKLV
jgi:hypothetical protein